MKYDEIVSELVEHIKLISKVDLESQQGLFALEGNILSKLVQLGNDIMQEFVSSCDNGNQGSTIELNEKVYKNKGIKSIAVHCLFGKVVFKRTQYVLKEKEGKDKHKCYMPLDERLGLAKRHTPACLYFLSKFTGNEVYGEGVKHFNEIFRASGIDGISLKKSMDMTNNLGEEIMKLRKHEKEKVYKNEPIKKDRVVKKVMAVSIDATKMREKIKDYEDKDGKKRYETGFKDAKIASISEVVWDNNKQVAKCERTSYVAAEEHSDNFFPKVITEVSKRSKDIEEMEVVCLGDGAKWIWDRVARIKKGGVTEILDFYHAQSHLSDVSKMLYGEETEEYKQKFKSWYDLNYSGKISQIIDELKSIAKNKRGKIRRELLREIDYFERNKSRMRYSDFRMRKLPIGSGTIESACKNVIGARMKRGGMIWSKIGTDAMLNIRSSLKSDRFKDDFEQILTLKAA